MFRFSQMKFLRLALLVLHGGLFSCSQKEVGSDALPVESSSLQSVYFLFERDSCLSRLIPSEQIRHRMGDWQIDVTLVASGKTKEAQELALSLHARNPQILLVERGLFERELQGLKFVKSGQTKILLLSDQEASLKEPVLTVGFDQADKVSFEFCRHMGWKDCRLLGPSCQNRRSEVSLGFDETALATLQIDWPAFFQMVSQGQIPDRVSFQNALLKVDLSTKLTSEEQQKGKGFLRSAMMEQLSSP